MNSLVKSKRKAIVMQSYIRIPSNSLMKRKLGLGIISNQSKMIIATFVLGMIVRTITWGAFKTARPPKVSVPHC